MPPGRAIRPGGGRTAAPKTTLIAKTLIASLDGAGEESILCGKRDCSHPHGEARAPEAPTMTAISALSNVQTSFQSLSQAVAGGNTDPSTIVGMASDQNQFTADVKMLKVQDDMAKEVLNLISPTKVDVTV